MWPFKFSLTLKIILFICYIFGFVYIELFLTFAVPDFSFFNFYLSYLENICYIFITNKSILLNLFISIFVLFKIFLQ